MESTGVSSVSLGETLGCCMPRPSTYTTATDYVRIRVVECGKPEIAQLDVVVLVQKDCRDAVGERV